MRHARLLAAALSLFGCTTNDGSPALAALTTENVSRSIIKGRTTESDLAAAFGPPMAESNNGGQRILMWRYSATNISAAAFVPVIGNRPGSRTITGQSKTLKIELDAGGLVRDYSLSQATGAN